MNLLVVNCGSSSLKCRLYEMPAERVLAEGSVDRLGSAEAQLACRAGAREELRAARLAGHAEALEALAAAMFERASEVSAAALLPPQAVAHRQQCGDA